MGSLSREQFNILVLLRDETLTHKIYVRPSTICKGFSPPLDAKIVANALDYLIEAQFVEMDGRDRYRITHLGSEIARITIEGQMGKNPKFDNHMMMTRSPWKFEQAVDRPKRQIIDWTKWGTVIAAVTLIVTVILWWFSR